MKPWLMQDPVTKKLIKNPNYKKEEKGKNDRRTTLGAGDNSIRERSETSSEAGISARGTSTLENSGDNTGRRFELRSATDASNARAYADSIVKDRRVSALTGITEQKLVEVSGGYPNNLSSDSAGLRPDTNASTIFGAFSDDAGRLSTERNSAHTGRNGLDFGPEPVPTAQTRIDTNKTPPKPETPPKRLSKEEQTDIRQELDHIIIDVSGLLNVTITTTVKSHYVCKIWTFSAAERDDIISRIVQLMNAHTPTLKLVKAGVEVYKTYGIYKLMAEKSFATFIFYMLNGGFVLPDIQSAMASYAAYYSTQEEEKTHERT